jgi:hypothetical protein
MPEQLEARVRIAPHGRGLTQTRALRVLATAVKWTRERVRQDPSPTRTRGDSDTVAGPGQSGARTSGDSSR